MSGSLGVVANPASGRGRVARILPRVLERLRFGGLEVEEVWSRSAVHATESAASLATRHAVVVAAGGDGMVHAVVNGIAGTTAALGIVPCGTGNDFAVNAGYSKRDPLAACDALVAGRRRRVDAGVLGDGTRFVCVAGGGFDSEVNRVANGIRWLRGTPVYVAAVLRTLARFRPARFVVTLDGARREHEGMFVAVGNAASYGGGMRIAPDARIDDGVFDVTIVGALSRPALLAQFPRIFHGTHVDHPLVTTARAATVAIECDRDFPVYADGEAAGSLPATMRVEPGALEVVVP